VDALSYKTKSVAKEAVKKDWIVVNAEDQVLGRFCSEIAKILRGKNKASFTPHVDCGDNVIVINAEKIRLTGNKWTEKEYVSYTGYPGGQRFITPAKLVENKPTAIIEKAVKGMLPKNRLGRAVFGNLYVYAGSEHPHAAQQPKEIKL
jgi:large subunit ribosomal protein L13